MKRLSIAAALALAACVPASAATTTTFTITVSPAILNIALSSTHSDKGTAGSVVGAVSLVWNGTPGTYSTPLVLGGTDAAKFALTNGGVVPCNLVIGSSDIPAGNYQISITAP